VIVLHGPRGGVNRKKDRESRRNDVCLIYTPDGRCATTEGYLTSPWGNHRMNLTPNAAKDRQYRLGNLIRFNSSRNALKNLSPRSVNIQTSAVW